MHEITIARKIIEQVEKEKTQVSGLVVDVGELAELTPEELKQAIEQLTQWKVTAELVEAEVECGCGYKGRPKITEREHETVLFECPKCTQVPDVISGDEIEIKEVL